MLPAVTNPYAPLILSPLSSPFAPRTVTQFFIMHCLQPTKYQHNIWASFRSLKAAMANAIVNHVTADACRTVAQLISQCAVEGGPSVLRLLMGSRARVLEFNPCDNLHHRKTFDYFRSLLQQHFLNDNQYISLQVMGAAAIALKDTMAVLVKCLGPGNDLVVHCQHHVGAHHMWPYEVATPRWVRVPYCRDVAVSDQYVVNHWTLMVTACITVHMVQGVGFERVAVWIPSRGFFARGQGYTAISRGKTLDGMFLSLADHFLHTKHPQATRGRHQRPRGNCSTTPRVLLLWIKEVDPSHTPRCETSASPIRTLQVGKGVGKIIYVSVRGCTSFSGWPIRL